MNKRFTNFLTLIILISFSVSFAACHMDISNNGDLKLIHDKTFKIEPGKELKLEASFGDVEIKTWDKSEVSVKIYGNEKTEKKVEFSFDNTDEYVEVIAKKERSIFSLFGSNYKMRFEITVPREFNSQVHTAGGDIRISDIKGKNALKTSGGDIRAAQIVGALRLHTSGGDLVLNRIKANTEISTSGGDISIKEFEGILDASTSGGDVHIEARDSKIVAKTSGGDVGLDYSGVNKGIELRTSGGDIHLRLPENINGSANFSSSSGDVSVNIKTNNVNRTSSKFKGDFNSGGEKIIAKTSGGDIVVSKK